MHWLICITCATSCIRALASLSRDPTGTGIVAHGSIAVMSAISAYAVWGL